MLSVAHNGRFAGSGLPPQEAPVMIARRFPSWFAERLGLFIFPLSHLQGQADRVNYLMTKQAKIVAMTCTHAALKRREFLQLGLKYDNLLMEESAQILEIETFIPMLLQVKDCTLWSTSPQTIKAVMIWFAELTMPIVFLVLLHGCKDMTCAGSVAPLCPVMCHA